MKGGMPTTVAKHLKRNVSHYSNVPSSRLGTVYS